MLLKGAGELFSWELEGMYLFRSSLSLNMHIQRPSTTSSFPTRWYSTPHSAVMLRQMDTNVLHSHQSLLIMPLGIL